MPIIDQPKPSQPKTPVPEQHPLQPGAVQSNPSHNSPPTRTFPEADDEEIRQPNESK